MKVGRESVKECPVRSCDVKEAQANTAPRCANAAFTQQHLKKRFKVPESSLFC